MIPDVSVLSIGEWQERTLRTFLEVLLRPRHGITSALGFRRADLTEVASGSGKGSHALDLRTSAGTEHTLYLGHSRLRRRDYIWVHCDSSTGGREGRSDPFFSLPLDPRDTPPIRRAALNLAAKMAAEDVRSVLTSGPAGGGVVHLECPTGLRPATGPWTKGMTIRRPRAEAETGERSRMAYLGSKIGTIFIRPSLP